MTKPHSESRLTPVDDNDETCDRTCADIRIYPSNLTHEDITTFLQIAPTIVQNRGDVFAAPRGKSRVASVTLWALSSEPHVSSKDIRSHLDWLLDQLTPSSSQLQDLQQNHDVKMMVNCVWWSRYGHGAPTLWPEQMARLANLNLECSFDIQFYGDEEA